MMRIVHLNPVEPVPFSGRAPIGYDCPIDITFRTVTDGTWTSDLVASLVITGRTTERSSSYVVPAIDVVNGKASVTIPGSDLTDPNGYVMTLIGSLNGRRSVLATGVLVLSEVGIPELDMVDIVDTIDIAINYDEVCELDITLWQDAAEGTPYDLTSNLTTVQANVYEAKGGAVLEPFTVTVLDVNKVQISLTVEQVNALPASCWWALIAGLPQGSTTLCEGTVSVTGTITPPLTDTTANYDYQKPNTGDPVSGQIIHGNYTQNQLRVAKLDHDGLDRTTMLRLVRQGDTIQVDIITWSVLATAEESGFFVFSVSPIAQAAVAGVVVVAFRRPVI